MKNKKENNLETFQDIQSIKNTLLEYLYWIFMIAMWIAIASSILRVADTGFKPIIYIQIALVIFFLFVFLFRKKIPYTPKALIILIITYILAQGGFLTFGLLSQGSTLFLLLIALTAILFNKKITIRVFIFILISFIIDALLFTQRILSFNPENSEFWNASSAWAMSFTIFFLTTFIIIFFWEKLSAFLIDKIIASNIHKAELSKTNKLLQIEIDSRKEAESLLKEQIKTSENLNIELHDTNSELEKMNELLLEAKEKVQAADNLKSSFLSNMSHEIRTPMNAIVGFTTLLSNDSISDDDFIKYINIIQSSSNSLLNIISDIVNMSKIEAKQFTIYPELVELNNFLDEITEKYIREIFVLKGNNVSLKIDKKIELPCNIIADKESLFQIIDKLMDNAIKFTDNGEITISFDLENSGILNIKIKDTGIGINENKEQEIYESFRQVDDGHKRKYGGTGLGLSIVKGLVTLLNGDIKFFSSMNNGADFNVKIPVIRHETVHKQEIQKETTNWKGKTILIIGKSTWDDKEMNQMLHKSNSILLYVETGFQGIETCQQHPEINIIIMATKLPDMNSFEVATMIKKYNSQIPILAHIPDEKIEKQIIREDKTWDDFIQNPIDKVSFNNMLNQFFK